MTFHNGNASYTLAKIVMNQLHRSGVERVVVSPGFRNSPLILAARNTPELDVFTGIDERGAAFFALGMAKSSGKPVAVICTSGTATANYLPAVMEANHSHVPLLAITADRPEELIGTGANQTTIQPGLYTRHVREEFDISAPSDGVDYRTRGGYVIAKAVAASLSPRPGPVHVNIRFREPFLPTTEGLAQINANPETQKFTFFPSSSGPSLEQSEALEKVFSTAERIAFVIGQGLSSERLFRIARIARKHGFPVIAEAASGFSFQAERSGLSAFQRTDPLWRAFTSASVKGPDLLVRFGAPPVSREFGRFLNATSTPQILFDEFLEAREPDGNAAIFIQGGMEGWLERMNHWTVFRETPSEWIRELDALEAQIEKKLDDHISSVSSLTEWGIHRHISTFFSNGANVFLGNSMPIRDFNAVFPKADMQLSIFANRGQSGIDGLVSSAAGIAYASGRETHALLGDLSTLHDISSFSQFERIRDRANLTIWIFNNCGGEIFRIVPTAKTGKEEWFTTPSTVDFSAMAKAFQIPYLRVAHLEELRCLDPSVGTHPGVRIIELLCDPASNVKIRAQGM